MPARPSVVCTECHRLKIGCDKALPCEQCTFHHRICEYQRPTLTPIDNDNLQERTSNIEQFYERERQKQLVPKQRTYDFDSVPPHDHETRSETIRQDALLATCPSDVFQLFTKVLSISPQRVSSIEAAHTLSRSQIPIFLISDHHYYIDRDGDPCVTPALLSLLPSLDEQAELLDILKVVFIFQPLGSYDDLVRRVDILRNAGSAVQETNVSARLNHLALYAIAAGAFALASIGGARPVLSSTRAITLYTAGRRALQLVINHPQSPPNPVDHLWSGLLLLQFLLFSHRLTGGKLPHSGALYHESVREEVWVTFGMVVHACKDREANQSLQHSVSQDVISRDLREWAKLACTAYYYEMHISDAFNVPPRLPIDPPFSQARFDLDDLYLTTRTSLTKLIKVSFHKLREARSKNSAMEVINSQTDAIRTFLATTPASLTFDVEDVGRIENVETAVQNIELVLDAWVGIVRMWRRLLASEADLPTTVPSTPSDTLEVASGSLSRGSPSALGESFSRRTITRATKPCIDLINLLRVQLEIIIGEPRFHFYLYCQAVPRRAFESGLVFARIITFCEEEQDQTIATEALEGLQKAIDLLERAARWFGEQRGETMAEEAETLKFLRILSELLDVDNGGLKRSREAMEGMSDISAARLGDLHGLRLPFTPDMLILDQVQPCRSPLTLTQLSRAQSSFHGGSGESATKSMSSSLAPSPQLSTMKASAVPGPSGNVLAADNPVAHLDKPTPVRPFGRPSSPVLNGAPHGRDREVEQMPVAKLRKIQPKSKEWQIGESDPRASQTAREVTMELDRVSPVLPNVPDARPAEHHHLQIPQQQQAANGAFTSSSYDPSHGGVTLNHSRPVLWLGHPPALTPMTAPEAYVHPHASSWAPPPMTGSTMAGMDLYAIEPYTSMCMSPMSFAPVASGPLHRASKDENTAVPQPYVSFLSATAAGSPAHSQFSSPHGLSPHPPSAPLHNEPTPESIPQPPPRARVPQHPQQQPWYYDMSI